MGWNQSANSIESHMVQGDMHMLDPTARGDNVEEMPLPQTSNIIGAIANCWVAPQGY